MDDGARRLAIEVFLEPRRRTYNPPTARVSNAAHILLKDYGEPPRSFVILARKHFDDLGIPLGADRLQRLVDPWL
jgi:hypothetical protein